MSTVTDTSILAGRQGPSGRLSDFFWRNPKILLLLMLTPPLLWLGVIYLGSLFALLLQSFFSIDDFSGLINYEFTLATYRQLLIPSNFDIILRTVVMAVLVTLAPTEVPTEVPTATPAPTEAPTATPAPTDTVEVITPEPQPSETVTE